MALRVSLVLDSPCDPDRAQEGTYTWDRRPMAEGAPGCGGGSAEEENEAVEWKRKKK